MSEKMVRISASHAPHKDSLSGGSVTIEGLNEQEFEAIPGMINSGMCWITSDDGGRLKTHPRREELPSPIKDSDMLPF